MADNIHYNEVTGLYSFASVKQKAWHSKGQILDTYLSSAEMLQQSGLDFTVEKAPNTHVYKSGKTVVATNSFFTYRTDTEITLGDHVTGDYEIVNNIDAFAFFDSIVGQGKGISYETAGALGKGETIFITARLDDYIRIGRSNDVIEKYLFLTTSHDGKTGLKAAFTPVRIVCQNTLNAALKSMEMSITLRHSASIHDRLKDAHKVMGLVNTRSEDLQETFNYWSRLRMADKDVQKLIKIAMAPDKETLTLMELGNYTETSVQFKRTVEQVYDYAMSAESQQMETTKGTVFGAYNAITGYYQNVCDFKDDTSKLKSAVFGGLAQKRAQKAFNLCTDFAQQGADIFRFN